MFSPASLCKNTLLLNLAIEPLQSGLERLMLANSYFRHRESPPSRSVFAVDEVPPYTPYTSRTCGKIIVQLCDGVKIVYLPIAL